MVVREADGKCHDLIPFSLSPNVVTWGGTPLSPCSKGASCHLQAKVLRGFGSIPAL